MRRGVAWANCNRDKYASFFFLGDVIKKQHETVRTSRQRGERGRSDSGFGWAAGQLSLLLAGGGGTGREAACTDSVIWQAAAAGAPQGVFGAAAAGHQQRVILWPQIAPASYSLHLPACCLLQPLLPPPLPHAIIIINFLCRSATETE